MGLRGEAAIVGYVELKPEKKPAGQPLSSIEQWADLARRALADAGIELRDSTDATTWVDGRMPR